MFEDDLRARKKLDSYLEEYKADAISRSPGVRTVAFTRPKHRVIKSMK